jgi:uncharacterized hydantoinase/oxoprolinase family protein
MADGGPATRERAGHRLARLICADRTMVSDADLTAIAEAIVEAQVKQVEGAIRQVTARHSGLRLAVVLGMGERIVERAATAAGLEVTRLSRAWGRDASAAAPAVSVAELVRDAVPGVQ